jgi:hypothetical protein
MVNQAGGPSHIPIFAFFARSGGDSKHMMNQKNLDFGKGPILRSCQRGDVEINFRFKF